ncbi:MAG: class I SAM-dependent methyltransferase [Treponema sp.]|jgi:2-polyprenyl-3-methyl-5-hydroxy-6-metoxy-1,4-benzoquinol methylase|nr:class I SAM-dependent methyltransferase [Treponema sp.]
MYGLNDVDRFSFYWYREEEKYLIPKYFTKGSSVLDLGCGVGRTTLKLYENSYAVKGVDISEVFINICKRRFPYIEFEASSFHNLSEETKSWDNVLLSWNGINYVNEESARAAIKSVSKIIKYNGYFIISSLNIRWRLLGSLIFQKNKALAIKNWHLGFKETASMKDKEGVMQYYSPDYFVNMLKEYGFSFIEKIPLKKYPSRFAATLLSPHYYYVFRRNLTL